MPVAADKTAETLGETPATPVTLTAQAAEKVKQIRVEEKIQDGYALRLKVLGGAVRGSPTTSTLTSRKTSTRHSNRMA